MYADDLKKGVLIIEKNNILITGNNFNNYLITVKKKNKYKCDVYGEQALSCVRMLNVILNWYI